MRINSITTVNSTMGKRVNSTPSFGEKACVPGDEFQLSALHYLDKPKELLKIVKKSKDVGNIDTLFNAVMAARQEELFLRTKAQEKEKAEFELKNAYHMYRTTDLTDSNASYLSRAVSERISELEKNLEQYNGYRPADEKKLKLLGKIAKELVKKDSFNPNERDSDGNTLIERAIIAKDDDLAVMIIRHKNFKEPIAVFTSVKDEIFRLKKKAKSWF